MPNKVNHNTLNRVLLISNFAYLQNKMLKEMTLWFLKKDQTLAKMQLNFAMIMANKSSCMVVYVCFQKKCKQIISRKVRNKTLNRFWKTS